MSLPQRVKHFYERVSVEREGALVLLPELYADDVRFVNPVVDKRGLQNFIEQWHLAFKKYKVFEFKNVEVTGDDTLFSLTYSMDLRFSFGPIFKSDMATDCHAREGKVFFCRDYFDPLGSVVAPFPLLDKLYRAIFSHLVA